LKKFLFTQKSERFALRSEIKNSEAKKVSAKPTAKSDHGKKKLSPAYFGGDSAQYPELWQFLKCFSAPSAQKRT
jgi:hypothetical protein